MTSRAHTAPLPRACILLALAAAAGLAAPALALPGDDECCHHTARWNAIVAPGERLPVGFDPATGRDTRNYPRDRIADYRHMHLAIDIADMNDPRFAAVQTLHLTPISRPLAELSLDARLLTITGVACSDRQTTFSHDGRRLTIRFDPPIPPGTEAALRTSYEATDPPMGLIWTPESPEWPGRPAQLHTQGQPEDNCYWFPCHDFPNERLSTELSVTAPEGFQVSANGRLGETPAPASTGGKGVTWRWVQEKPHVSYLVSLVVGKFDVVDVATRGAGNSRLSMPVYVPPGRGPDVARTYGRTPEMIRLFERLTGAAYPWDRYAQLVVWNFAPGGMENTSATTMYDTAIFSEQGLADSDLEGLISHELAHQWFGDLLTCNSWEHIWLNEGFATYFTNLWLERREKDVRTGQDGYYAGVQGNFDSVTGADKPEAPFQAGMVSKVYADPWDVFRRPANPYPKGAAILHMLRRKLGDDVFFRALAVYTHRHQLQTVETADFRKALEEVSGESLELFFKQWCHRPGVPSATIQLVWDESTRELAVNLEQTQPIDGANPAFVFDLPILIHSSTGRSTRALTLPVRGRSASARFTLDAAPAIAAVDPELTVLGRFTIAQPLRQWLTQLERGPTLASRIQAARALGEDDTAASIPALLRAAGDTRAHAKLSAGAIESLRKRSATPTLIELSAAAGRMRPDTRIALVEALSALAAAEGAPPEDRQRLATLIAAHAGPGEPSFRTRAAALRGLGRLKDPEHLTLLLAAARTESQHDAVRQGALDALADLDHPEGLSVALRCAQPGTLNRTRATAINAAARLAHHDKDVAYTALASLLSDRERRTWEAAGEALVTLGDPRAAEAFQKLAESKRDDRDKKKATAWLERLTARAEK
ncbi:MAG: M1 family aminopeptidase [Phycisphaerales bacterium]